MIHYGTAQLMSADVAPSSTRSTSDVLCSRFALLCSDLRFNRSFLNSCVPLSMRCCAALACFFRRAALSGNLDAALRLRASTLSSFYFLLTSRTRSFSVRAASAAAAASVAARIEAGTSVVDSVALSNSSCIVSRPRWCAATW